MFRKLQAFLLLFLFIFVSKTLVAEQVICPQDQKPTIMKKRPPVGAVGVSRTRAFFIIRKIDGTGAKFIWCAIKTQSGKKLYDYRGHVDFSDMSDVSIKEKSEKKLFSKTTQKYKSMKIYFKNISRKRTVLKLEECFDQKMQCSSGTEMNELYKKIKAILNPKNNTNCKRDYEKNCQGDPLPYAQKKKIYCESTLYDTKGQRPYDFFIKATKESDISLNKNEKKLYKFRGKSDSKSILGPGYYLKAEAYKFNKKSPKKLWQWEKLLSSRTCTLNAVKEIEQDIAKEFSSQEYINAYDKEAHVETRPGNPATKNPDKIAVFVLGAAASGKTTTTKRGISIAINYHFCPSSQRGVCNILFKIIDGGIMRDVSRVWLNLKEIATDRGYAGFKDQYNIFSPFFKKMKEELIDKAITQGQNIIIPETAAAEFLKIKGGPVKKLMDKLHKAGYKIFMTSIYVDKSQADKFGKERALKEGKSYSSIAWEFSQQQTEILFNYARTQGYDPKLPMYIFDNSKKYWKITDPAKWFATKGVKTTIPQGCQTKRSCTLTGTCRFSAKCK